MTSKNSIGNWLLLAESITLTKNEASRGLPNDCKQTSCLRDVKHDEVYRR